MAQVLNVTATFEVTVEDESALLLGVMDKPSWRIFEGKENPTSLAVGVLLHDALNTLPGCRVHLGKTEIE